MVDIMIFPYKSVESRIHSLDARLKLLFVLVIFIFSILISDILYLALLFVFVILVTYIAKIFKSTLSILKYAVYIALFVFLFNILISSGSNKILNFGPVVITTESIFFAISMCLRLFLAVSAFSILTYAIHPDEALRAMSKLGYKITSSLSLSLRMYPTIAADVGNIIDSMKARGMEFEKGKFADKIKSRAAVIMPLLLNSLERSISVAEAMETRGFGATKRTNFGERRMTRREILMASSFGLSVVLGISLFVLGYGNADYLSGATLRYSFNDIVALALLIGSISPIMLGGRK
ncbi:MAG: energy-coupling factor transporter transmembrane component T [Methanomassiliicoccales archaeon]|jgi:energy-coupling factor transport system permease protein|nr:energy-coupling factor transporter transmembrane component T [Methanomassiliicoccales archaeon]